MPHLAATPDALCKCDCCGGGIIEIKCPFKHKDSYIKDVVDKAFCLDENGILKKSHMYFYQVCCIIKVFLFLLSSAFIL